MQIVKLSDIPILKVMLICIKNKWKLERYWKSPYIDLDIWYILNNNGEVIYDQLTHDELCKITGISLEN